VAYKSNVQEFQTSWNKTVNWAKSQGIPQSAIYPVYQLDSKRLLSGTYPMSEAERTRAILAADNPNNVTPLPTDTPSTGSGLSAVGHFFSNVEHDAANIFTGLQPTKLIPSIVDGVVNTVEHPNWILNPEKNTLAQWIPGVAAIGEYMQGGWSNVASHPLISFLDVLPLADTGVGLLAKAGLGAGIAERAGIPEALLGRSRLLGQDAQNGVGALTLARKVVGNLPTRTKGLFRNADGLPEYGNLTVSTRLKHYANTHMAGSDQAHLAGSMVKITSAASHDLASMSQAWDEAYAKLSPDQARQAYDIWTGLDKALGGNDRQTLINNDALAPEMKQFFKQTFKVMDFVQEKMLASGEGAMVEMPDGTTEFRVAQGVDDKVVRSKDRLAASIDAVDKASKVSDRLADNIEANDTVAQPAFDKLSQFNQQVRGATDDPAQIAQLIGRPVPNATQLRLVNEIYGEGGLIDQVMASYESKDFDAMRTLTLKLSKKFKNKSISGDLLAPDPLNTGLQAPVRVSPLFATSRDLADNLYKYARSRKRDEDALSKAITKGGLHKKIDAYAKATKQFDKDFRDNPAANWQPLAIRLQVQNLAKSEEGKVAVAKAVAQMKNDGAITAEAEKEFREDPTRMIGIIMAHTKASATSVFAGMLSPGEINRAMEDAKSEIESLRAQGFVPHWVPNVTSKEAEGGYGEYHIRIQPLTHQSVDSATSRMLDMRNTVYDIHAGFSKAMWQQVSRDANAEFIDDIVIPGHAYKQADLEAILAKMHPDMRALASDEASLARVLESEWGLVKFDPDARFGISSKHIKGGETLWMPKEMVDGLQQIVDRNQMDPSGGLSKATQVFRTAVLGYSPRFIAHIGFGGTFLLALRHPTSFRFIPDAIRMMRDPDFRASIHTTSTQIGFDKPESMGAIAFHDAAGKTMAYHWMQQKIEELGLDPSKMTSYLQVIPQMVFKLTNLMTDMQRTLVYLDGAAKAEGRGFYVDPETGERLEMTDARAQEEGMRAANRTMGNLSAMSPFERNTLTTIMPFYGWTKHVLTYVAEYPVDHPYRAMFLANLANQNSDNVALGYYTRIQNLFFLGTPDQNGNVSAVDVRALNPLRDVANYATLGGFISALNPVISAPFAAVDPQIVFGSNTLYPTVSYSQLYGTKEASAGGNILTAAEQFVPELTTVDAAFGLSAQYRDLQRSNPAAFTKLIFESLNIPFAQVQHINLKQIAAQQELDRYSTASAAAQQAFETGNFGALGNVASVPNPLQTDYNISPANLEAVYNQALKQTGLPPSETVPEIAAPTNI